MGKVWDAVRRHADPQFTFTSGGGPGLGMKLRHYPLMVDMDPTGPGAGITIPLSAVGRIIKMMPTKRMHTVGEAVRQTPGSFYTGFELAGILPLPFIGASVGLSDKDKLLNLVKRVKKKKKNGKARKHKGSN